jgi:hypothetical protein
MHELVAELRAHRAARQLLEHEREAPHA